MGLWTSCSGSAGGGGPVLLDPADEPLTGWLENYTGSPWSHLPSAGTSGSRANFTEATNPPAAVSGAASADGSNDKLTTADTASAYFGAGTPTAWALDIVYEIVAADIPAPYGAGAADALNDPPFLSDSGAYFTAAMNSTGPKVYIDDGVLGKAIQVVGGSGTGKHNLQVVSYDDAGTKKFKARVDGGAWSTPVTYVGIGNVATAMKLFVNHAGLVFLKAKIHSMHTYATTPTDAKLDELYASNAGRFSF